MLTIYRFLLILASPLVALAALFHGRLKGDFAARFLGKLGPAGDRPVWLHAASVGELHSARPVILRLIEAGYPLFISTFTPAGLERVRALFPDVPSAVLPLELPWAVKNAIRRLKPRAFLLVESDFFPSLLAELAKNKVPCALINGRISEKSAKRLATALFRPGLAGFKLWLVQEPEMLARSQGLLPRGCAAMATGNIKWDGYDLTLPEDLCKLISEGLGLGEDTRLVIGASTHAGEEEALLESFTTLQADFPGLRLLLAPRHIQRAGEVANLALSRKLAVNLRSRLPALPASVLVLDTMGELVRFYGMASAVFVGGSLSPSRGGQDPVPAALSGVPVLYGPYMRNFSTDTARLEGNGGHEVADTAELTTTLRELLSDDGKRERDGKAAHDAFAGSRGGLERTTTALLGWLKEQG